jgi:hypothetical protein
MGKPLKILAIVSCLILAVLGGPLPLVSYLFLLFGLHILVCEFETGRDWVRTVRARWPVLSRFIARARRHPWAPRRLHHFDDLTDPLKTR